MLGTEGSERFARGTFTNQGLWYELRAGEGGDAMRRDERGAAPKVDELDDVVRERHGGVGELHLVPAVDAGVVCHAAPP